MILSYRFHPTMIPINRWFHPMMTSSSIRWFQLINERCSKWAQLLPIFRICERCSIRLIPSINLFRSTISSDDDFIWSPYWFQSIPSSDFIWPILPSNRCLHPIGASISLLSSNRWFLIAIRSISSDRFRLIDFVRSSSSDHTSILSINT